MRGHPAPSSDQHRQQLHRPHAQVLPPARVQPGPLGPGPGMM